MKFPHMKIFFIIFLIFISCGRWKTTKLKPDLLFNIPAGSESGDVMLNYNENDLLDISLHMEVHQGSFYLADNILKRLQVIDKKNGLLLSIGANAKSGKKTAGMSNFHFSAIGKMAVDSDSNIYVQNQFTSSMDSGTSLKNDHGISPSYITVFNDKGTLLYTLGKTGSPDIPFDSIEWIGIDNDDRLFIVSRSFSAWDVHRFMKRKKNFYVSFSDSDFQETDGDDKLDGKIEKVMAYCSGDDIIISVAYYSGSDFRYRKLLSYSIEDRKISIILNAPDPKNELFSVVDDKYIYLWDVDEERIKFIICNFDGNIINNIVISYQEDKDSFSDIMMDNSGQFYSYHVNRKGINVMEWR